MNKNTAPDWDLVKEYNRDPQSTYKVFKDLCKNTAAEKLFSDDHPYAYVENIMKLANGVDFVHLTTGYNRNCHISIVQDIADVKVLTWTSGNYSGYECYMDTEGIIHEAKGFGFGSWRYYEYDHKLNLIREWSKQDFGCCCN